MTYDSSISTEVSLSKILDKMILDDTPIDIIVQFLESHESCVKDIFANSVFVYDLYDVATSCSFPDKRLEKYICCLPPILMFFVLTSCVELALELDLPDTRKKYAYIMKNNPSAKSWLSLYTGLVDDRKFISAGIDFIKYLEVIIIKSQKGFWILDDFIKKSHFLASAMLYRTFLNLSSTSQWVLINNVIREITGIKIHIDRKEVLTYLLVLLMKQLLWSGHVDMFEYIKDMLSIQAKDCIRTFLFNSLPSTIRDGIALEGLEFEEIVFEMNMVDSTFDTLDLFLYAYICNSRMRESMMENKDLLEFFDLPFSYNCLWCMK